MKKLIAAALVCLLAIVPVSSAYACCGHRGEGRKAAARYAVCAVEDCTVAGLHRHGGAYCTGHFYGDGHDYHGYCDVDGCTLDGYHEHDGAYCFGGGHAGRGRR